MYKLSDRITRVVFLLAVIVVSIDLMIWRPQ
jgi:hypothetical protein